jgi:hypothetical protein
MADTRPDAAPAGLAALTDGGRGAVSRMTTTGFRPVGKVGRQVTRTERRR